METQQIPSKDIGKYERNESLAVIQEQTILPNKIEPSPIHFVIGTDDTKVIGRDTGLTVTENTTCGAQDPSEAASDTNNLDEKCMTKVEEETLADSMTFSEINTDDKILIFSKGNKGDNI